MLKADRYEGDTSIAYFMNEVGQRGGVVSFSTVGSGAAMDQSLALATYAANPSGFNPIGILLNDMVQLDLTRQHPNWHKDEVQKGGKVTILTKGWVVTDQIASGLTIGKGDEAYVSNGGRITNVNGGSVATPKIGRFESTLDQDGFAKVAVNLPL